MTAQTRSVNKAKFENGDQPQGSDYADLVDSFVSIADTTAQTLSSDLQVPILIATTEVSAPLIITQVVSASSGFFTTLSVTTVTANSIAVSGLSATLVSAATLSINGFVTAMTTASVTSTGGGQIFPQKADGFLVVQVCGQSVGIPYLKI